MGLRRRAGAPMLGGNDPFDEVTSYMSPRVYRQKICMLLLDGHHPLMGDFELLNKENFYFKNIKDIQNTVIKYNHKIKVNISHFNNYYVKN